LSGPPRDAEGENEIDPGEPIPQLANFEHQASGRLLERIRRAIQRRSAVAQLTAFTASVPLVVFKELWLILIEQLGPKKARKDVIRGKETS
jgi:hypothetical protein